MAFGIHPTQAVDLGEVMLVRDCTIERDGETSALTLSFMRPKLIDQHTVEGALRFHCQYFDKTLAISGGGRRSGFDDPAGSWEDLAQNFRARWVHHLVRKTWRSPHIRLLELPKKTVRILFAVRLPRRRAPGVHPSDRGQVPDAIAQGCDRAGSPCYHDLRGPTGRDRQNRRPHSAG